MSGQLLGLFWLLVCCELALGFECQKDMLKCTTVNKCVPQKALCDLTYDCPDKSDEVNCKNKFKHCYYAQHFCQSTSKCINVKSLCNGVNDCGDNSDERFCKTSRKKKVDGESREEFDTDIGYILDDYETA